METNLELYLNNSRDIYCMTEKLFNQCAKKVSKGITLDYARLYRSSYISAILREARKELFRYDKQVATKKDIEECRKNLCEYVIETANYIANKN